MMLGLNQVKKPSTFVVSSSSSKLGSCDNARAPLSLTAGMMRAAAYMTKTRYASDIMTLGVIVMTAPTMRLKAVCVMVGSEPRACMSVVYEAMIIGGNGGRAGSEGMSAAGTEPGAGW